MKDASPYVKILFLLTIVIGSFLVTSLLGTISAVFLFDLSFSDLNYLLSNIEEDGTVEVLKYLQAVQTIGIFILPAFIFAKIVNKGSSCYLKLDISPKFLATFLAVLSVLSILPLINLLGAWNLKMKLPDFMSSIENWIRNKEEGAAELTRAFLTMNSFTDYCINLFVIALLPALGEELLFRGVLQRLLFDWSKNMHISIFVTAMLFSALHLQFYGFMPRVALGLLFGYLLYWSDSIWYPIIAHFFNNAIAVTAYFFLGSNEVEENIDKFGTDPFMFYIPIFALITLGIVLKHFSNINSYRS